MCGICGIFNYRTGEPADVSLVEHMTASIVHRGPDDDGFLFDGSVALGMRRLSIIDLAGGKQPISGEDGRVSVVYNGEIYNFRELRAELEGHGHQFKTRTDTEVIVHAYEQWGLEALARLNGMFGLALWDARSRRLILARDPFGIKPLYVYDDGSRVVFGSELRAILCDPSVPREIDVEALDQYLTFTYVPAPRTAFAGIAKLQPGHALVCDADGCRLERYRRVVPATLPVRSVDEAVEELQRLIVAAVRRQMVADVPVGVMLSGGVDSSVTAAIMTEIAERPVMSFTAGFGEGFAQDEVRQARALARRIGSEQRDVVVDAGSFMSFLPKAIWHLEEPVATASTLPFYRVSELARRHVKVVLTGQGADELFAGYPRYLAERYSGVYRMLPAWLRREVVAPAVRRLPRNEQAKRAVRSLGTSNPAERMWRVHATVDDALKRRLYRPGLPLADRTPAHIRYWQRDVEALDGLTQMQYVDARTSLPDNLLLYGDKMSMAVSLEARVPFLDLELTDFVESLPPGLKINGRTQKHLLKRAVARWLPPETTRRKKIGFATPFDAWARESLHAELAERLLGPDSACRAYFRPEALQAILSEHRAGREDHKRLLFSLLTFEVWHGLFIRPPNRSLAAPALAS